MFCHSLCVFQQATFPKSWTSLLDGSILTPILHFPLKKQPDVAVHPFSTPILGTFVSLKGCQTSPTDARSEPPLDLRFAAKRTFDPFAPCSNIPGSEKKNDRLFPHTAIPLARSTPPTHPKTPGDDPPQNAGRRGKDKGVHTPRGKPTSARSCRTRASS